jgi:predicted DNA-binding transcriptional regulator AlpA
MNHVDVHVSAAPALPPASGYWDMKALCSRFCKSRRTIFRWMKVLDFPRPRMAGGTDNLWAIEDVLAWEASQAQQQLQQSQAASQDPLQ